MRKVVRVLVFLIYLFEGEMIAQTVVSPLPDRVKQEQYNCEILDWVVETQINYRDSDEIKHLRDENPFIAFFYKEFEADFKRELASFFPKDVVKQILEIQVYGAPWSQLCKENLPAKIKIIPKRFEREFFYAADSTAKANGKRYFYPLHSIYSPVYFQVELKNDTKEYAIVVETSFYNDSSNYWSGQQGGVSLLVREGGEWKFLKTIHAWSGNGKILQRN